MPVGSLIARRCVLFIGDLDPAGPHQHYETFRQNLQKFAQTWGTKGSLTPPDLSPDTSVSSWRITTKGPDWTVQTEYRFWDWSGVAAKSLQPWTLHMAWLAIVALVDFIKSGTCWRYLRANPRFGFLFLNPAMLGLVAVLLAWWLTTVLLNIAVPYALPMAVVVTAAGLGAFLRWGDRGAMSYMSKMSIFLWSVVHLKNPELASRLGAFSNDLIAALKRREFDEVVVIGHGLGVAFLPIIVDRAFWAHPEFGKSGEKISLLTLAPQLLTVGLHPEASWLIGPLSRVARDRMVYWLEYQMSGDTLGFPGKNGVEILTESKGRPDIKIMNVPELKVRPKGRLDSLLTRHRALLEPASRRGALDFFMVCCGPFDLKTCGRTPERLLDQESQSSVSVLPA